MPEEFVYMGNAEFIRWRAVMQLDPRAQQKTIRIGKPVEPNPRQLPYYNEPSAWCPNWKRPRNRDGDYQDFTLVYPVLSHIHTPPDCSFADLTIPGGVDLAIGAPNTNHDGKLMWLGQFMQWSRVHRWGRIFCRGPVLVWWIHDYRADGTIDRSWLQFEIQEYPGNTRVKYEPSASHFAPLQGGVMRAHDPRKQARIRAIANQPLESASQKRAVLEPAEAVLVNARAEDFCEGRFINFRGFGGEPTDLQNHFVLFDMVESPLRCEARNIRILETEPPEPMRTQ